MKAGLLKGSLERNRSSGYFSFMDITPEQIRAARALLRLEQAELAQHAHVSVVTIRRLESVRGRARVTLPIVEGVRRALEQAGAEFIPDGVRRRSVPRPDADSLYDDLRRISLQSAARQQGRELLTEDDLYDEDGLPA
jgi:transcriptional regulator with XRE-family HTH domain